MGFNVGDLDGAEVGASVGFAVVGLTDGAFEGLAEGGAVGEREGDLVGGSVPPPPPPPSSRMHEPLDHTQEKSPSKEQQLLFVQPSGQASWRRRCRTPPSSRATPADEPALQRLPPEADRRRKRMKRSMNIL